MTPAAQPKIQLSFSQDYREGYANSVQVRANLWDFLLLFGTINQTAPDSVNIRNFQGVYLSPQQAKALAAGSPSRPQILGWLAHAIIPNRDGGACARVRNIHPVPVRGWP
jgi:hypothetical protein